MGVERGGETFDLFGTVLLCERVLERGGRDTPEVDASIGKDMDLLKKGGASGEALRVSVPCDPPLQLWRGRCSWQPPRLGSSVLSSPLFSARERGPQEAGVDCHNARDQHCPKDVHAGLTRFRSFSHLPLSSPLLASADELEALFFQVTSLGRGGEAGEEGGGKGRDRQQGGGERVQDSVTRNTQTRAHGAENSGSIPRKPTGF
uniref:Uncharacterized protein n=1 Tax=Chromera velia CCMP2878 TaxID=1169474 RepID=A0A0G4FCE7_9ALVE|eukprot:Cvel_16339.t1-p1 / transcript=Cvel_16339.t1 / gene=Cvel_16339 / organism=Chromera_velia_CCMP2878 / gene_product=hypothetical protein / transcript_product=hypothetical protein / location=Cvel_scaffold1254:14335-21011(-) / protein_length=203 / sequence_SO=supercontig / SO=protein_coding / is_pseudo=false